jgi:hypothetical protein
MSCPVSWHTCCPRRVSGQFGAAVPPYRRRYEEDGMEGLINRRLGDKASARRIAVT